MARINLNPVRSILNQTETYFFGAGWRCITLGTMWTNLGPNSNKVRPTFLRFDGLKIVDPRLYPGRLVSSRFFVGCPSLFLFDASDRKIKIITDRWENYVIAWWDSLVKGIFSRSQFDMPFQCIYTESKVSTLQSDKISRGQHTHVTRLLSHVNQIDSSFSKGGN